MKFFATFAPLLLLATAISAHGKSSNHQHGRSLFQSRAQGDSCTWKCSDARGVEVPADQDPQGSWAIDIVGGPTTSTTLTFFFDVNTNLFVIFNRQIRIVITFMGDSELMSILNLNTNQGLIVGIPNGQALHVDLPSDVINGFATDVASAFQPVANLKNNSRPRIFSPTVSQEPDTFDLGSLINGMQTGQIPYEPVLGAKPALKARVILSFGSLITAVSTRMFTSKKFNVQYGVLNILVGVLGTVHGIQQGYLHVIFNILRRPGGFTAVNAALAFRLTYKISLYFGGFLSGQIFEVNLQDDELEFTKSNGGILFRVLRNSYITVRNTVVGIAGGALKEAGAFILRLSTGRYMKRHRHRKIRFTKKQVLGHKRRGFKDMFRKSLHGFKHLFKG